MNFVILPITPRIVLAGAHSCHGMSPFKSNKLLLVSQDSGRLAVHGGTRSCRVEVGGGARRCMDHRLHRNFPGNQVVGQGLFVVQLCLNKVRLKRIKF